MKWSPPVTAEVFASASPELVVILICSRFVVVVLLMGFADPLLLMVAAAPVKVTEVKFANGNTPVLEEGASAIHSAEVCFAVWDVVE